MLHYSTLLLSFGGGGGGTGGAIFKGNKGTSFMTHAVIDGGGGGKLPEL